MIKLTGIPGILTFVTSPYPLVYRLLYTVYCLQIPELIARFTPNITFHSKPLWLVEDFRPGLGSLGGEHGRHHGGGVRRLQRLLHPPLPDSLLVGYKVQAGLHLLVQSLLLLLSDLLGLVLQLFLLRSLPWLLFQHPLLSSWQGSFFLRAGAFLANCKGFIPKGKVPIPKGKGLSSQGQGFFFPRAREFLPKDNGFSSQGQGSY